MKTVTLLILTLLVGFSLGFVISTYATGLTKYTEGVADGVGYSLCLIQSEEFRKSMNEFDYEIPDRVFLTCFWAYVDDFWFIQDTDLAAELGIEFDDI